MAEKKSKDPVVTRLDALIRLFIEKNKTDKKEFTEGEAAKILKSVGLMPTEIAKIFGKEKATEVSKHLYKKGKKKKKENGKETS